jgi:RimJ/RimL family protein N-acetyltransferase
MLEVNVPSMVWEFLHDRLKLHASADFRGVLWASEDRRGTPMTMDDVAAAVGFNTFIGKTCCMHVVVQEPQHVTRKMIRDAFDYAFNVAKVEVIFGPVDSTNAAAIEFDKRIGFREIGRFPGAGLEGDLVLFAMTRDECRWIRGKEH